MSYPISEQYLRIIVRSSPSIFPSICFSSGRSSLSLQSLGHSFFAELRDGVSFSFLHTFRNLQPITQNVSLSHFSWAAPAAKLNPYSRARMTEAWQQHAVAPPPVVHTIPAGAENALSCAVYGIVLQPDASSLQQQQHGGGQQQQEHPPQAQQSSLQVVTESVHKCGTCGHDISHLANPLEHQCMVSQDRSFQCTQCLKIFHQATDLLEHQCVQVEQKPFVCGVCKMGFSLLTSLAQHHTSHNSSNPMKCSICEKTYRPGSSGNTTPTSSSSSQPSSSDGASASSSSSILPFPSARDRPYKCSVCQKGFKHLSELTRHERVHTGEKPFKCDTCDKAFSQSSHLQHHQRTHSSERPFKCAVCEKSFKHRSHLVRHMYVHSGEHLFKCNLCELHFKESSELLHHPCHPQGSRPFRCATCGKGFKRPSDLRQHERTHSEERPFHCDECQMSFKQQYALVRHRRTHKDPSDRPFKCSLCDKGFMQPSHLLYHQHVHGMDNLFKCASCQKEFSQSGELLRHKCGESSNSSPDKPYKCDVCGKGYKKSSTLQRHQNSHCQEKPLKGQRCWIMRIESSLSVYIYYRCVSQNDRKYQKFERPGPWGCRANSRDPGPLRLRTAPGIQGPACPAEPVAHDAGSADVGTRSRVLPVGATSPRYRELTTSIFAAASTAPSLPLVDPLPIRHIERGLISWLWSSWGIPPTIVHHPVQESRSDT
ncbi:hypothetical protein XENOCAPTIV_000882 [Xenoophorus captivus]|uniref:C2H2-type domain-containing protein n=1 Tax=Xenoophorus captivus TaxID=1517983 RepID=A0ABV0R7C6_9TELE